MENQEKKVSILNFMGFCALIAVAVLEVFSGLSSIGVNIFGEGSIVLKVLNTIKNVCIVFVVGVSAYRFVARKTKGYKITFWVAVAIFIVATVIMWIPTK